MEHVTDHATRALARLVQCFKDKPKLAALAGVYLAQIQELEDVFWDIFTKRVLLAEGVQLDVLGRIVGELRLGASDADYLPRILAKIRANRSGGTVEDLYAVIRAALPRRSTLAEIAAVWDFLGYIQSEWPTTRPALEYTGTGAEFAIDANWIPCDDATGVILGQLLAIAKVAGTRGIFIFSDEAPVPEEGPTAFRWARWFTTMGASSLAGATTLTVADASTFPSSGALTIDAGLAVEESLAYTKTNNTTLALPFAASNAHTINACVTIQEINGWGDDLDPDIGGKLASAIEF